ncbi:MAG: permease [Enterococcus sp.]
MFDFIPHSALQMSTIFLSIVIEALPFVLLGCIISGALQVFLTPERVQKWVPKNRFLSIIFGCFLGFFFPSCECGIVPIVHQFVRKGVPVHTAFAFMLTAPIINPIVIFSTFIAFGNSFKMAFLRMLGSFIVALIIGIWLAYFQKGDILREKMQLSGVVEAATITQEDTQEHAHTHGHTHVHLTNDSSTEWHKESAIQRFFQQISHVLVHAVEEFFDTGRYLIIGGLLAAAMQTYLPTGAMLTLGSTKYLAILVMLVLALTMSLCSEADAFIGSSLMSLFGTGPVAGFLVFGPMVDIKNLLMMKRYFSGKFIAKLVGLIVVSVFIYAALI